MASVVGTGEKELVSWLISATAMRCLTTGTREV